MEFIRSGSLQDGAGVLTLLVDSGDNRADNNVLGYLYYAPSLWLEPSLVEFRISTPRDLKKKEFIRLVVP